MNESIHEDDNALDIEISPSCLYELETRETSKGKNKNNNKNKENSENRDSFRKIDEYKMRCVTKNLMFSKNTMYQPPDIFRNLMKVPIEDILLTFSDHEDTMKQLYGELIQQPVS